MIELSNVWVIITCLWVAYLVYGGIWRLYLSPIAQFPGSRWAALTLWYEFYFDIIKVSYAPMKACCVSRAQLTRAG